MLEINTEVPRSMKFDPRRAAMKIAVTYVALGWLWILTSDQLVSFFTQDPETMVLINSLKGSAFILLTAIVLFSLVFSQLKLIHSAQQNYLQSVQELEDSHEELMSTDEELRRRFDELSDKTQLLEEKESELWSLFENMHDAFALHEIIRDPQGIPVDYRFLAVNPAYERLFGSKGDDVIGRRVRELQVDIEQDWIRTCGEVAGGGGNRKVIKHFPVLDRHLSISLYSPKPGLFAVLAMDATDEIVHARTVERLAYYDALTGLPNRAYLTRLLRGELEEKQGRPACGVLLYLDMDDLKLVNDSYGHSYGDAILITAAMIIVSLVEANSVVSRVGGDEFVVLVRGETRVDVVERLAQELVQTLSCEYEVRDMAFHSSASVGIACYPENGSTAEEIYKNADTALYEAKRSGKRCWRFFTPSMQEAAYANMLLLNGLRSAIANDELTVYYQPQIDLEGFNVVGFEALLRWNSSGYGIVSPAQFIPLAEKNHLINDIGEWVLVEACRFSRRLLDAGFTGIRIAVNVSPRQLADVNFIPIVNQAIQNAGITAEQLEFEITESVFIETMDESVEKLQELRDLGIHLSLDDFGTGYSSLTYLRNLPVQTIKIDKSFTDLISQDASNAALIDSIIDMAHVLGLQVVAEGVETAEQLQILKNSGCDMIQGYIAGRPVPEPETKEFLTAGSVSERLNFVLRDLGIDKS